MKKLLEVKQNMTFLNDKYQIMFLDQVLLMLLLKLQKILVIIYTFSI